MNSFYKSFISGPRPFFIMGPCVIESAEIMEETASVLSTLAKRYDIQLAFKASFDKANRTSISSFRGPGLEKGLLQLADIKEKYGLPILTDIHESHQAKAVAKVADIIQIPAFLCRQTDLLKAAAATGVVVNIKKAQFLSAADMYYPAQKVKDSGNENIILTERGNIYGYNNLIVDFRNIADMKALNYPVVMDCTHAVQRPGAAGGKSGGNKEYVPAMALAAKAFGADGYFLEVHPDPSIAKIDGPNMLALSDVEKLIQKLIVK